MKKITSLMMVLVAMLLLASCSKQQSVKLIPENAVVVVRFDPAQLSETFGLNGDKGELSKWMKKELKSADLEKEVRDKFLDIIEDPSESGIDVTEPLFLYVANPDRNAEVGFVGTVASKSKLTDLLNMIGEENGGNSVEEADDGVSYYALDRRTFLVFTGNWFYIGESRDADDLIETLQERLEGEGSLKSDAFDKMCDQKGLAQLLVLGEGLSSMRDLVEVESLLPEGLELKDVACLLDLSVDGNAAVITSEYIAASDEWENYFDKQGKMLKSIDSDQAKYISDRGFSAFVNLDTKDLYKYIEQLMKSQGLRDREVLDQVKTICKALDGKASFDLYGISDDAEVPSMSLYVGSKNNKPALFVRDEMIDDSGDSVALGDEFRVPLGYDYDWDYETWEYTRRPTSWGLAGYRNGQTFFATDADKAFSTPSKRYPTGDIKGKGVYMRFNFDLIGTMADNFSRSEGEIMNSVAEGFDYAELYAESSTKAVFRVVSKDKKKNPFQVIVDLVKDNL